MGSSDAAPMEFDRGTEILPATATGVSSLGEFQQREAELLGLDQLKRRGLSEDEICLYRESQAAGDMGRKKMESGALREKLHHIYSKLEGASNNDAKPSTSVGSSLFFSSNIQQKSSTFYPDQHPMNSIKDLEKEMFDHIKIDEVAPITKRRKMLRRMRRKEDCLNFDSSKIGVNHFPSATVNPNLKSLWDVREVPKREPPLPSVQIANKSNQEQGRRKETIKRVIGPQQQARYTIKDNKIVRLEAVQATEADENGGQQYRAVDIVVPVNKAEQRMLEGTKLTVDQIRSMERFKNYEPGRPSKVLFLKNISSAASDEDISILFNQYLHENQAPIDVRLMSGRLRGQAFVHFQYENVAIQALEDINGTVVKGRPVIAQFGKSSNHLLQTTLR